MKKKIYFIGIGGIAMANLACFLKKQGYFISGSDLGTFGPSALLLEKHKIKYFKNHGPKNIQKLKPDVVVIGNAIQRGNPALEYVLNNQIQYCSMPEIIRKEVLKNKKPLVVSGTSGKTTTAALLAWILKWGGLKPSAFIGGVMKNTDSGFMVGNGRYVVVEGDEYNSSFYDSSPKFLHYSPYHVVITNIQPDHLDIYGSIENIFKAFKKLAGIIPAKGSLILNNADQYTPAIAKESKSKTVTFGKNGDVWTSGIKMTPEGLSFIAYSGAKRLGEIKSRLLGKHNVENILAAVALALELRVPFKKIAQAIADFEGVERRLEIIYPVRSRARAKGVSPEDRGAATSNGMNQKDGITVIDDFAHNPDKVLASLSALRGHFPKHQIIAIFEPRTGSSRRKFFQNSYIPSFKPADLVYVAEPYKKSVLGKKEVFSSWRLAKDLNRSGTESYSMKNADRIVTHLKKSSARIFQKPTIIVVMTSGEFDGIHQKLIKLVNG